MVTWKIFCGYILLLLLILVCQTTSAQVIVTHYNAEWNKGNDVKWLDELSDCDIAKIDIVKYPKFQKKHKIVCLGPQLDMFKRTILFLLLVVVEEEMMARHF